MDLSTNVEISDCRAYYGNVPEKDWEEVVSIFPDKEFLLTKFKNKRTLVKIFKRTRIATKKLRPVYFYNLLLKVKLVYCDHSQYNSKSKKTYIVYGNIRSVLNFISKKYCKESDTKELISIHIKKMKFKRLSGTINCY